jgi:hypothetical protein
MHGHWSHDVIEVAPRHTSTHQMPVHADHERQVHFNPSRTTALILRHSAAGRDGLTDGLAVEFIAEGGNCLLDPPRLLVRSLSGKPVTVTVESLLYALKQMQDATGVPRG